MPGLVELSSGKILRRGLRMVGLSKHRIKTWRMRSLVHQFKIHFGAHPKVYKEIWISLQTTAVNRARVPRAKLDLDYFLMAIYFLRVYPTQEEMVPKFDLCRETIDTWLWYYLEKIQALKEEKIVWPEEWLDENDNPFIPYFLFSVDGVDCMTFERQSPSLNKDPKYYSHKFNSAGLTYEVAIDVYMSRVVHINGPFPSGRGDKANFRSKLKGMIPAGSVGIADGGYIASDLMECLAFPSQKASKAVRKHIQRARARHETFYGHMKKFKVLAERFRSKHSHNRDAKHQTCFEAVAVILQYDMENGNTLFTVDHGVEVVV